MSKRRALPAPLSRKLAQLNDNLQLAILRRVIWANRSVARVRRWAAPVQDWLWVWPVMLVIGFAGGYLTRLN